MFLIADSFVKCLQDLVQTFNDLAENAMASVLKSVELETKTFNIDSFTDMFWEPSQKTKKKNNENVP